jgi:hypothetical protein
LDTAFGPALGLERAGQLDKASPFRVYSEQIAVGVNVSYPIHLIYFSPGISGWLLDRSYWDGVCWA